MDRGASIKPVALVAGGAGFLGSHVCDALLEGGYEVVCVDNLDTGDAANIAHLGRRDGFSFVTADIRDPIDLDIRPDLVMNLASPASPPAYLARPVDTLLTGSEGTRNTIEIARRSGATYLLASSSEIYGDPEVHPQPESYRGNVSTTGIRSVYDEAKRFAEALTMAFHRAHGVDIRIVRIFNTYGPRLQPGDGRAIPNFIAQALADEPITVYGDGSQTRSFCYVDDLVSGLLTIVERGGAEPINLGNPDERSVLDLAQMVVELTGSRSKIETRPLPADDPRVRCPDITRARALGWEPQVDLRDGLKRTIEWFRNDAPSE